MPAEPLPLKEFHTPDPIGWWPPAPGWWLALAAILLSGYGFYLLYRRFYRPDAVKTARKMLRALKHSDRDNIAKLTELSVLMRRVAISLHPRHESARHESARHEVAGLTGEDWLAFLNRSVQGAPFTAGIGRWLALGPYQREPLTDEQMAALVGLCEQWLSAQKKHHASF